VFAAAAGALAAPAHAAAQDDPGGLDVTAMQRTRYESLRNQSRAGAPGDDRALSLRTTILAELRHGPLVAGVEIADSRLYLADDDTPLNTTFVNPIDLLQGFVGVEASDLLGGGSTTRVRVGRFTMNLGSRRFVARNIFRNTISSFTGIDVLRTGEDDREAHLFVTIPVDRRPSTREELAANVVRPDRESTGTLFWGVFLSPWTCGSLRTDVYVLGLHEGDSGSRVTANRRLVTSGLRLVREPAPGTTDFEIETAVQTGVSRASTSPTDTEDLDHLAYFLHASIGRSVDTGWQPRVVLQYDRASGDRDPADGRNGSFDTLFGARRFEFGPTGIYGALARSNISSIGLRLTVRPTSSLDGLIAYRAAWLARRRDAWTTGGIRDVTGSSGSFVGQQVEAALRWRPLGRLAVETGLARMWLGPYPPRASGFGSAMEDPSYLYAQIELTT
jgi:hypothetical protein